MWWGKGQVLLTSGLLGKDMRSLPTPCTWCTQGDKSCGWRGQGCGEGRPLESHDAR